MTATILRVTLAELLGADPAAGFLSPAASLLLQSWESGFRAGVSGEDETNPYGGIYAHKTFLTICALTGEVPNFITNRLLALVVSTWDDGREEGHANKLDSMNPWESYD